MIGIVIVIHSVSICYALLPFHGSMEPQVHQVKLISCMAAEQVLQEINIEGFSTAMHEISRVFVETVG